MKVWITKYALTQGVYEAEVIDDCRDTDPSGNMIAVKEESFTPYYHGKGKEWHETKESAISKAEQMRQKKISSLKKQIEKLEKMKFE